jgi:hypothetical protein
VSDAAGAHVARMRVGRLSTLDLTADNYIVLCKPDILIDPFSGSGTLCLCVKKRYLVLINEFLRGGT